MTRDQGISTETEKSAIPLAGDDQYRHLFEESLEGICLADPETGIIQDCNPAFEHLTGYARSELIGRSHTIFHRKEDIRAPFSSTFDLHRSKKRGKILTSPIVTKSGIVKEVEIKAGVIDIGGRQLMHAFFRDITEEQRGFRERETTLEILRFLNDRNNTRELIRNLTESLQRWSGCDAVGIRLRDGDDFPYYETRGFSGKFLEAENYLCQRDIEGQLMRDPSGKPILECMCGNILCGRYDPDLPFFTKNGSFWSNGTTELLATTTDADRQAHTRNRCNATGYESVALIPLRYGERIMGLLQLNDRRTGHFTLEWIAFLENISTQIALTLIQRKTQAALESSEEFYRKFFEVESDTIFLVDTETLRYIDVNGAALEMYGYTREEFLRMKADDVSAEPEKTREVIYGGHKHVPLRWHRKKDGTVFPVELSISSFVNQGRQVHVAAIRDITERIRAETELRESEERYRGLFENLTEGYAFHRMIFEEGKPADYVFLAVNKAFETLTGLKNVIGKKATEAIPGIRESNPEFFAIYGRVAATGIPEKLEAFVEPLDSWFSISVYSSQQEHFTTVFENITDRKKADISLRKSEELFSKAFHGSPMVMAITSLVDHRYIDINEAFEKATGYSREEVVGRDFREIDMWCDPDKMELAVWLILNEGKYRGLECAIRHKSGERRLARLSAEAVEVYGERCTLTVAEDVTERKQIENALRKSEAMFSKVFHDSPIAMVITSITDYRILDINEAFLQQSGYSREELLGLTAVKSMLFFEPQDLELAIQTLADQGKIRNFECPYRTRSGEKRLAQLSAEIVDVAEEPCLLTVALDITERKQAENALRKSEALFSKAFHGSPVAMTISSMLDRRIIDVNDAFLRQSGYTREEIVGRPPQETMAFFDFGRMQGFRQTLFDQGYLHNIECPFRTRSGERRCAIFSAEIVEIADEPCMLAVALDVTESKLAAQALEKIACDKTELLKKMNDAQHLARIGSWEWDILTDRMWWSDETYRIFGASPGELVPSLPVIEKFLYTADLELFHNSIAHSLRTGEPLEQDCRISVGQDPLVYCHIKGEVVADDADKPVRFLGTIMDITEKNQAEKALREVEERFRLTFEHIANGMAVFEAVGDGEDFRIKEFNPAAERICRVKRDEVLGRLISQAFPSIKDIGLFAVLQRVSRTGIAERLPASYYVDDNVALWVENDVIRLPSGEIVSIFDDITDRKLAEAEMRKSETWHRSLVELGVSAYIVLNEKRRIEYASQLVEKIFGWQPAEMFGMSAFEFVISEDLEAASRFFAEIAKTPRRKKRIRVRVRLKNGDAKVVEMFGINLFDEPAVRGIVLSSHDITEQVRAEERIESFRQELTHASRMASLGALAAGIAHEINQPLSIMSTWTEIAQREIRDRLSGDKREASLALARIDAALERSSLIVRNMRNFVRKSESSVTSISLAEAIEDVRMFLSHQIRTSGVAFSVESSPEFPPVLADRTQVQQVLMNLVLNALEAMECDEISARCMEIRVRTNGDLAEVAVSDSGCGLSPDQLEHIFEPFHTTKAEGLGLGLSICRSIIQWHGGRIWAARNADRGLTFTFTLPVAKEKNRHAKKTDHLHRGRRTRGS